MCVVFFPKQTLNVGLVQYYYQHSFKTYVKEDFILTLVEYLSFNIILFSELERRGRAGETITPGQTETLEGSHLFGVSKGCLGKRCLLGLVVSTRTADTSPPFITHFFLSSFLARRIKT